MEKLKFSSSRIIGGREAKESDVPYQVAIMTKKTGIWCGGAIYSRDTVITAAHCFEDGMDEDDFLFVAGKLSMEKPESSEQLSTAETITKHPNYILGKFFDLAIVKLTDPFCFSPHVQPIPIATSGQGPKGKAGTVLLWPVRHINCACAICAS